MNKLVLILVLGIALRIFLALNTFHPDLRTFQYAGYVVGTGNILNLYDYLQSLPSGERIKDLVVFNYPPAIYLYHGVFNAIFSFIFGSLENNFLIDIENYVGNVFFNIHLLLLKLPYLIFDILTAIFLAKLFDGRKEKILAFSIWVFNPINLYSTYMMGQFDLIPNFFVVLSLYFLKYKKLSLASLSLGAGIAFKIYPLFLLLPLAFLGKTFFEKVKLTVIGFIPYILTISPYLFSEGFRREALAISQTSKSFFAQIAISGAESIILFIVFLILFLLLFYKSKIEEEFVWVRFFAVLILFFIFTHFHPQWFLWLSPFLIIDLVKNRFFNILALYLALVTYMVSIFLFDSSLTTRIFSPLFPNLYYAPTVWQILNISINDYFVKSLMHSIFTAVLVYYIYYYWEKMKINVKA